MRVEPIDSIALESQSTWADTAPPRIAIDCARLMACWVACVIPAIAAGRLQYTWSLLIFVAPLALTLGDLVQRGHFAQWKAPIGLALALLFPMGLVLTVGLADDFFVYPATSAVVGITLPALDVTGVDHAFRIPVEELAFYLLGFASLLTLYAWLDSIVVPITRRRQHAFRLPTRNVLAGAAVGLGLTLVGAFAQRVFNPTAIAPGYWIYLMLVPVPVVVAFAPVVAHRINWVALSIVCLALWGHSVLWEASLAIPQGWWGYQPASMIGLSIKAWSGLPIEAVVVWLLTPIASVVSLEAIRAHLAARRSPP